MQTWKGLRTGGLTVFLLAAILVVGGLAFAQGTGYDLSWWTVDGGGGAVSNGGYAISGTAGQPEAAAALNSGGYTVHSGFWAGGDATTPSCPDTYEPNEGFNQAMPITPGQTIQAYICNASDQDWFRFNALSGEQITVDLTNLPADYDLYLYNPAGNIVEQSASGGTAEEHITYTVTVAGLYRVRVFGYNGAYDAGNPYTLRVQTSGGPSPVHKVYAPVILK